MAEKSPARAVAGLSRLVGGPPHGESVRTRKTEGNGNYKRPTAVYLIYIGLDPERQLMIQHRYKENVSGNIAVVEDELMKDAVSSTPQYYVGKNFDNIVFKKKRAYFSIVLDIDNWNFYFPEPSNPNQPVQGETHDPLVFVSKKTPNGPIKSANYSFYNAREIRPENSLGVVRNGVRFTNFLTANANGDALPPNETQDFCFEIYLRVPFSDDPQLAEQYITIIIDPDGQNQGPD